MIPAPIEVSSAVAGSHPSNAAYLHFLRRICGRFKAMPNLVVQMHGSSPNLDVRDAPECYTPCSTRT
jgi:hypothetical protein